MIGKLAQVVRILEEEPGNEFLDGVGGIVEEFLWFHVHRFLVVRLNDDKR